MGTFFGPFFGIPLLLNNKPHKTSHHTYCSYMWLRNLVHLWFVVVCFLFTACCRCSTQRMTHVIRCVVAGEDFSSLLFVCMPFVVVAGVVSWCCCCLFCRCLLLFVVCHRCGLALLWSPLLFVAAPFAVSLLIVADLTILVSLFLSLHRFLR